MILKQPFSSFVAAAFALTACPSYADFADHPVTVGRFAFDAQIVCTDGTKGDHLQDVVSVPQGDERLYFSPGADLHTDFDTPRDPWALKWVMSNPCNRSSLKVIVRNITASDFLVRGAGEGPIDKGAHYHAKLPSGGGEVELPDAGGKLVIERRLVRSYVENDGDAAVTAARKENKHSP